MKIIQYIACVSVFCSVSISNARAEMKYDGSSTIGMGVLQAGLVAAYNKKHGNVIGKIENSGTGKGIQKLIEGKVNLSGASRPLKEEELAAGLEGVVVGYDAIVVFVHANNPVNNLTREQLKGIFTGKIRNWLEVGGFNMPIRPNTEILTGKRATIEMFKESILGTEDYGKGFKQIDLPKDQIIEVAKDRNGIATVSRGLLIATSPEVRSKVKLVLVDGYRPSPANVKSGTYPISRALYLVTKGKPAGNLQNFINFVLSDEGQAYVGLNFVKVK